MPFKMKKSSFIKKLLLICFLIFAIIVGNIFFFPQSIPNNEYKLVIEKDQNLRVFATNLESDKIIKSAFAFRILSRTLNKDTKITAGLYILKKPMSLWGLLQRITNGKPDQISIMLLDGWRFDQIKEYVDSLDDVQHLTKNMTEEQIKAALKLKYPNLEGLFFPSTYYIAPNQTDLEIYQTAYKLMQNKLAQAWESRNANTYYTKPYELLIMASLIIKETSDAKDMIMVSTVFNNRLRIGMKLQDDPAVFYGLRGQTKVTRKDFQIDTPYNTYLRYGLPPTPITTPSWNALTAASKPESNRNVLYFVAIGSGKTKFSYSYAEHSNAVDKYLGKSTKKK